MGMLLLAILVAPLPLMLVLAGKGLLSQTEPVRVDRRRHRS
jgi:hypothetical protein